MQVIYEQLNGELRNLDEAMNIHHAKQLVLRELKGTNLSKIECYIRYSAQGEPEFYCSVPHGIVLNIGQDYYWRDPDRDYSSGFVTVVSVDKNQVTLVGGNIVQRNELSSDKPIDLFSVFQVDKYGDMDYCGKATSKQEAAEVCAQAYADNPDDYICQEAEQCEGGKPIYVCSKQKPVTADLTLKISIRYLLNSTTEEYLRNVLQRAAEHLSDMGMLTGETDAEAVDHRVEIF